MMEFVIITAAVATGLVVGTLIVTCVMLSEFMTNKIIKWSVKTTNKMINTVENDYEELLEKIEA